MKKIEQKEAIEKIAEVLVKAQTEDRYVNPIAISLNTSGYEITDIYDGFLGYAEDLTKANNRIADAILELAKAVRESK